MDWRARKDYKILPCILPLRGPTSPVQIRSRRICRTTICNVGGSNLIQMQ